MVEVTQTLLQCACISWIQTSSIRHWRYYFFAARFCAATFPGGVYFFGKPAEINNGWIRYIWAIQWQLLDAVCSICSLPVLQSAMKMSCTTQTALSLTQLKSFATCAYAAYTSHKWYSRANIHSSQLLLCSYYLRAVTIQGWWLFK